MAHPNQPPLSSEFEAVWLAALADAELAPSEAMVYPMAGRQSTNGFVARHWLRRRPIDPSSESPELESTIEQMNDEACLDAYRVAIWADRSLEGIAALLRHELEHARQLDAHGKQLLGLYEVAEDVLKEHVGGLKGGALLYQMIPVEFDANSASAVFVRAYFGDQRIDELLRDCDPDSAAFRGRLPPPPLDTLPERMLQYLAAVPHLCQSLSDRSGIDFSHILDLHWRGAGKVWDHLIGDDLKLPRR